MALQAVIAGVLGAGGATFLWTIVRSFLAIRNSTDGREETVLSRLERFEESCRTQLWLEREWSAYWQHRAANLEYMLREKGIEPPVLPPRPTPYD